MTLWIRMTNNLPFLQLVLSLCAQHHTLHSIVWSLLQEYRYQLLQWPTTLVLKPVSPWPPWSPWCHLGCVTLAHLRVIFTAFFVPWLDGWQGHSGGIVKWPPKKALNSLRLLSTHLISWYRGIMQQFPLLFASKLLFPRKMIISARSPTLGEIWHSQCVGTNLEHFAATFIFKNCFTGIWSYESSSFSPSPVLQRFTGVWLKLAFVLFRDQLGISWRSRAGRKKWGRTEQSGQVGISLWAYLTEWGSRVGSCWEGEASTYLSACSSSCFEASTGCNCTGCSCTKQPLVPGLGFGSIIQFLFVLSKNYNR